MIRVVWNNIIARKMGPSSLPFTYDSIHLFDLKIFVGHQNLVSDQNAAGNCVIALLNEQIIALSQGTACLDTSSLEPEMTSSVTEQGNTLIHTQYSKLKIKKFTQTGCEIVDLAVNISCQSLSQGNEFIVKLECDDANLVNLFQGTLTDEEFSQAYPQLAPPAEGKIVDHLKMAAQRLKEHDEKLSQTTLNIVFILFPEIKTFPRRAHLSDLLNLLTQTYPGDKQFNDKQKQFIDSLCSYMPTSTDDINRRLFDTLMPDTVNRSRFFSGAQCNNLRVLLGLPAFTKQKYSKETVQNNIKNILMEILERNSKSSHPYETELTEHIVNFLFSKQRDEDELIFISAIHATLDNVHADHKKSIKKLLPLTSTAFIDHIVDMASLFLVRLKFNFRNFFSFSGWSIFSKTDTPLSRPTPAVMELKPLTSEEITPGEKKVFNLNDQAKLDAYAAAYNAEHCALLAEQKATNTERLSAETTKSASRTIYNFFNLSANERSSLALRATSLVEQIKTDRNAATEARQVADKQTLTAGLRPLAPQKRESVGFYSAEEVFNYYYVTYENKILTAQSDNTAAQSWYAKKMYAHFPPDYHLKHYQTDSKEDDHISQASSTFTEQTTTTMEAIRRIKESIKEIDTRIELLKKTLRIDMKNNKSLFKQINETVVNEIAVQYKEMHIDSKMKKQLISNATDAIIDALINEKIDEQLAIISPTDMTDAVSNEPDPDSSDNDSTALITPTVANMLSNSETESVSAIAALLVEENKKSTELSNLRKQDGEKLYQLAQTEKIDITEQQLKRIVHGLTSQTVEDCIAINKLGTSTHKPILSKKSDDLPVQTVDTTPGLMLTNNMN